VDDVVQSVFEALARDAHRIDVGAVAAWLRKVTRSKVVDYVRARREMLSDPPEPPSEQPDPEATLRSRELAAEVRRALDEVVSSRRRILVGVALEDRSLADVARAEGIPEGTARSRLEQGARDLRMKMERRRTAERDRTGGFTSWGIMWAILGWRAHALTWVARARALFLRAWPKLTSFAAMVTGIGAIVGMANLVTGGPARAALLPVEEQLLEVDFEAAPLAFDAPAPWAPSCTETPEPVRAESSAARSRDRHDIHQHFEREAFGDAAKRP
jgi:RNA polymerase sigma-70 factor (ECF subfamily)